MDDTFQCFLCKGPIRLKNLNIIPPPKEEFGCITCLPCDRKHNFLRYYASIYAVPYDIIERAAHSSKTPLEDEEQIMAAGGNQTALNDDKCVLGLLKSQPVRKASKISFWPENWTKNLCKCEGCKKTYMNEGLSRLVNDFDELLKIVNEQPQSGVGYTAENHEFIESCFEKYLGCYSPNSNVIRKEDIEAFYKALSKRSVKI